MGIIMVGAIFQLTEVILSNLKVISVGDNIYNIIYGPYNLSMNLLSFWVVFQIGFNYAQSLNLKPMTGAINAALCFLLVASSGYSLASMEALTTGNLGGTGLFIAILVGLVTQEFIIFV
ncbi:MAG: hypothetical protein GX675_04575 [Erysipelotrichaceae bacterium]|nr:hypothetical protein [Erysipelotrichaceae bacterium]